MWPAVLYCKHDVCNNHYCEDHYWADTSTCDVCELESDVNAFHFGVSGLERQSRFCVEHKPTQCARLIADGDREDEVCGFRCCALPN